MRKLFCLILLLCSPAMAADITFQWNPSVRAESYTFYCSPVSGVYDLTCTQPAGNPCGPIATGSAIEICEFTWPSVPPGTNFIVVRGVNVLGESPNSNEADLRVPTAPGSLRIKVIVDVTTGGTP